MQITAEVAGADIQMEHATVKAGPIKHIEQTKIPRSGDPALLIEVEAGQFFFTDMPEGLGEVLADAFGKWEEARNA